MTKPVDVGSALWRAPVLRLDAAVTADLAARAFPQLMPFNTGGVLAGRFVGRTPWERHPDGDELLYVVEGSVEITLLTDAGPERHRIDHGSVFVVPRGVWHRQHAAETALLLSATPLPTEVSGAEDPRPR